MIFSKEAVTINDDEPDDLCIDNFVGRRKHCWVLLKKGKRGVEESCFIEPSTGRIYKLGFISIHYNFHKHFENILLIS